jgi:hypothetical protein
MNLLARSVSLQLLLASAFVQAQQPAAPVPTTAAQAPARDTSYIDAQGTAHVTRVVPVPKTISAEAQRRLSRPEPDQGSAAVSGRPPQRHRCLHGSCARGMESPLPQSARRREDCRCSGSHCSPLKSPSSGVIEPSQPQTYHCPLRTLRSGRHTGL